MGIASQVSLLVVFLIGILSSPRIAGRGHFLLNCLGGWILGIPAVIMAGVAVYQTYGQFIAWQGDAFSAYLLPPHHSINYFVSYAVFHFWAPHLMSGALAVLVFWLARAANKKFNERFFEKEELYFLALGIFLTSHPGWILYVLIVLSAYVVYSALATFIFRRRERVSFYYFWLPSAAATIIASAYMTQFSWYNNFFI